MSVADDGATGSHLFGVWARTRSKTVGTSFGAYVVYLLVVVVLRLVPQGVTRSLPSLIKLWAPFIVAAGQAAMIGAALLFICFRHRPRKDPIDHPEPSIAVERFHVTWLWLWASWCLLYVGLAGQDALSIRDDVWRQVAACQVKTAMDTWHKTHPPESVPNCTTLRVDLWIAASPAGTPEIKPALAEKGKASPKDSSAPLSSDKKNESTPELQKDAVPAEKTSQLARDASREARDSHIAFDPPDDVGRPKDPDETSGTTENDGTERWAGVPIALQRLAERYEFERVHGDEPCAQLAAYDAVVRAQAFRRSVGQVFLNFLNNLSTAMFVMLFYVLARVPSRPDRVRVARPEAVCFTVVLACTILEATLIAYGQSTQVLAGLRTTFGFAAGIAMALFVGRLESKFIGAPLALIFALYCYAVMQASWGAFETSPILMVVMTTVALGLKGILYLMVFWLYDSGLLLHYFREVAKAEAWVVSRSPNGTVTRERRSELLRRQFVQRLHRKTAPADDPASAKGEIDERDIKDEIGREEAAHELQDALSPEEHTRSQFATDTGHAQE
jgi:hypothetical protein